MRASLTCLSVLAALGLNSGATRAQEPADSLELMILAWANIEGYEPIAHPAGPATSVCLILEPWQGRSRAVGFSDLSPDLRARFVESLQRGGALEVRDDCVYSQSGEDDRGWWLDGEGTPASRVMLTRLEERRHRRWSVAFWIGQGGFWGREEMCSFVVNEGSGRIVLERCRLAAIN